MMRVLLTGSNGLVAQHLGKYLLENNTGFLATSRGENRTPAFSGQFRSLDITDREAVWQTVAEFKPTHIVHTAAISHVDVCEQDPDLCRNVNVNGTRNIVEAANNANARLVHLSSDFVFDGTKKFYSEDDEPAPISVYGKSKLEAEKAVQQLSNDFAVVRTVLVYGFAENAKRNNILSWVYRSLQGKKPIKVVTDQYRTPTSAYALAEGLWLLLKSGGQGVFHISGDESCSVFELAQRIAKVAEADTNLISPVTSAELGQPGTRPPKTGFTCEKAKKLLNYSPGSLESGLRKAIHRP